jgi:hypothetical protein
MTTLEQIARFTRDHYKPLEPSELKEEAKRLTHNLEKEAAGRVCEQSRSDWEDSYKRIDQYYAEKRAFEEIVNAPRPKLKGRKAAERIPFL